MVLYTVHMQKTIILTILRAKILILTEKRAKNGLFFSTLKMEDPYGESHKFQIYSYMKVLMILNCW
jgi:hypothetical protein